MDEIQWLIPAIWGLLPEGYREDWQGIQHVCNTLTTSLDTINTHSWYGQSLLNRRCLIPVTGFFTSYLHEGILYPFYIKHVSGSPFCLAGIYTYTEDGYITFSLLTRCAEGIFKKVQNVDQTMPLILNQKLQSEWLTEHLVREEVFEILSTPNEGGLEGYPIARECFNNNISFDSMLEPVHYKNLPVTRMGL
jgi:putative SOS response-associated peptidase YedK